MSVFPPISIILPYVFILERRKDSFEKKNLSNSLATALTNTNLSNANNITGICWLHFQLRLLVYLKHKTFIVWRHQCLLLWRVRSAAEATNTDAAKWYLKWVTESITAYELQPQTTGELWFSLPCRWKFKSSGILLHVVCSYFSRFWETWCPNLTILQSWQHDPPKRR